jgi:hypothetical protein
VLDLFRNAVIARFRTCIRILPRWQCPKYLPSYHTKLRAAHND